MSIYSRYIHRKTTNECHPGTSMSPEMTKTLKADSLTNEVRSKALVKLINETPLDYTSQALEVVNIGYNGVGNGHKEATKDCEHAVSASILLIPTGVINKVCFIFL